MEDQVGASQEYVTPGQLPRDGNYYADPQGPRFNNPAEFDQAVSQPTPASMAPMPDFRAMKEAALQQAINQVRPAPQPQPEPRVVYVRRNLTIAELILVFALATAGVFGVQGIWTLATDVLPRLEIREK